jgi:two-component system sensor histidine kinase YesM
MESNVSAIVYNLDENIQRENDNIKYFSYNSIFREKLGSGNASELAKELNTTVEPIFWYFLTSDQNLKAIRVYAPSLRQEIGNFIKPIDEFEKQSWYEENNQDFKTNWFCEDGKIYATRILLDATTSSEPIGIIEIEVQGNEFIDCIYQSKYLKNGVTLVDQNGSVIGSRAIQNSALEEKIQQKIASDEWNGFFETEEYLIVASDILSNGWKIFFYIDKAEISDQVSQMLAATAKIMGLCIIIVSIFIGCVSRLLSRRILRLKGYAEEVSSGNFQIEMNTELTDEIGIVEKSFSQMCRKVNQMMEDMYQLGLEKRAEELKALQAMINPHFLANCLSSIKWKAIRAEQDEIADVAGLTAKFYRTALNGGKQITTVANELENIKAYLEIQSRTHDNAYDVEYELAEEGQERPMPNFLLQPLVENAIHHGVDFCEEGIRGKIKIEYVHDEEYLVFRILNNGAKLKVDEIEKILKTRGKGYGLFNIQERIKIFYNDEKCGVFGSVVEDGMTCFTVRLKDHMEASVEKEYQ